MTLSIIIPNYNGFHFLSKCLDSIYAQTFTDYQIILVDNGSNAYNLKQFQKQHPTIRILALPKNEGFAQGCNMGIQASSTPYVMLLNNDTILDPHCIQTMMETIQKKHDIFSVGAKILTMNKPYKIDTTGDFYSLFGYAFCRLQGCKPCQTSSKSIFTNCGCAVIYRTSLLKKTGLFDADFFAYLEDVDLGMRARLLGFRNIYCENALVYHYGSGTTTTQQKYSAFKVYYSARNNVLLRAKNLSALEQIFHSPFFLIGTLLKYIFFRKLHLEQSYQKGLMDGFRLSKKMKKSKQKSFLTRFQFEAWILYGTYLYLKQFFKRRLETH